MTPVGRAGRRAALQGFALWGEFLSQFRQPWQGVRDRG